LVVESTLGGLGKYGNVNMLGCIQLKRLGLSFI